MKRESKKTFTYSGKASTKKAALKRAKSEGLIFSELVEKLLLEYSENVTVQPHFAGMGGSAEESGPR